MIIINVTILPADTYIVVNKTVLDEMDRKIISLLYQPIIGHVAVSLYYTLLDDLDKLQVMSDDFSHHHLMSYMQLRLDDVVMAREKLEAVGLLKTYVKQGDVNHYVYMIYSPISASEFFSHPILNIVLYNNLGKNEYDKLLNYFKIPKLNLRDYQDITVKFSDVFKTVSGRSEIELPEMKEKSSNSIVLDNSIDFNLLISSIPKSMLHERCFSSDVKNLINSLAFTYNIDDLQMQGLVRDSLNEKGMIDKNLLRKSCRNSYQFDNYGMLPTLVYVKQPEYLKKPIGDNSKWAKMVYTFENTTPYDYLKAQYKGSKPTSRDLRLIENLLIEQRLKPGVVNVLISYVLKINNQKLNKSYIEAIVGQWKRLNIETVEDAMRITEKEHKRMKKVINRKKDNSSSNQKVQNESLPEWFDKKLEKRSVSKEEEEEINKLLSSY